MHTHGHTRRPQMNSNMLASPGALRNTCHDRHRHTCFTQTHWHTVCLLLGSQLGSGGWPEQGAVVRTTFREDRMLSRQRESSRARLASVPLCSSLFLSFCQSFLHHWAPTMVTGKLVQSRAQTRRPIPASEEPAAAPGEQLVCWGQWWQGAFVGHWPDHERVKGVLGEPSKQQSSWAGIQAWGQQGRRPAGWQG